MPSILVSVHICTYQCIFGHIHVYDTVCVHLQFTSQIRACMTRAGPCIDWGPTLAVSDAGYWFETDTCNMNRYEQDMCMCDSVQICGGDTNRYKQI